MLLTSCWRVAYSIVEAACLISTMLFRGKSMRDTDIVEAGFQARLPVSSLFLLISKSPDDL